MKKKEIRQQFESALNRYAEANPNEYEDGSHERKFLLKELVFNQLELLDIAILLSEGKTHSVDIEHKRNCTKIVKYLKKQLSFYYPNGLPLQSQSFEENDLPKKESFNWFKIGILFANGQMDKYYREEYKKGKSYDDIAEKINPKKPSAIRSIISSSFGDGDHNNNIFSRPKKYNAIIEYCEDAGIDIVESFYDRIQAFNKC